ncbi:MULTISPECIES: glycosyltransferase [Marinovum]|uniref:glycosyltransferase n=1 Tax=Marinovum TaxID=367771 RepID=UPI00237BD334|nr:glycosyltransferase [Marinovum sp. PR37]MDD9745302.1 glycosyltransferase [Marinovum sp. PR37]
MPPEASFDLTVVIPAHDEAAWIRACLVAVLASRGPMRAQVVVVANGCRDATADLARAMGPGFDARGWRLDVLELAEGSKIAALNAGDAIAAAPVRAYLDADVTVYEDVLGQLAEHLSGPVPAYGSGTLEIVQPRSAVSRAYARVYRQVPFIARGVPGCGLFAVNAAGRARWADWPPIISDDTFARLHFSAAERHAVPGRYRWPLVEGWRALVRVRRRQNIGVTEIRRLYPALAANDEKPPLGAAGKLRLALNDPAGFAVYAGVALATRLGTDKGWSRGR